MNFSVDQRTLRQMLKFDLPRVFFGDNQDHVQCLGSFVLFLQNFLNATGNISDFFLKSDGGKNALAVLNDKVVDELKEEPEEDDDNREHLQTVSETLSGLVSHCDGAISGTR